MWPLTAFASMVLPAVNSASISDLESSSLIRSDLAPLAKEMSGTNENTLPAWIAPNVMFWRGDEIRYQKNGVGAVGLTMRTTKNSNVVASSLDTSRAPYQNTRAMTKKTIA